MPLNEQECRREDFRGGVAVEMADGQEWFIPRPRTLFVPDDGEAGFARTCDLGPEFTALRDAFSARFTQEGGAIIRELMGDLMRMFVHLLGLNYEIPKDKIGSILALDFGPLLREDDTPRDDHEIRFMILRDIALGNEPAPKPTADGSGSA